MQVRVLEDFRPLGQGIEVAEVLDGFNAYQIQISLLAFSLEKIC